MKTLTRQIIIRDCDLGPLMYKAIRLGLYNSIEVEPLTYKELQHENLMRTLAGNDVPCHMELPNIGSELLFRENNLYNRKYLAWYLTMDYPDGQIYVQSRSDQPHEPLLRATFSFEKNV